MKKILLAFMALAFLTFSSCDKEDDEAEDSTPTVANLSGTYKITAVTANGINVFDNSIASLNAFPACRKDDLYKLNTNLSFEVVDAGTVCSPSTNTNGTWSLNGNVVMLNGETSTIESFDGRTVIMTRTEQGVSVRSTFVKQ